MLHHRRRARTGYPQFLAAAGDQHKWNIWDLNSIFYLFPSYITQTKWPAWCFELMTSHFWWRHQVPGVTKKNARSSLVFRDIFIKSETPTTLTWVLKCVCYERSASSSTKVIGPYRRTRTGNAKFPTTTKGRFFRQKRDFHRITSKFIFRHKNIQHIPRSIFVPIRWLEGLFRGLRWT